MNNTKQLRKRIYIEALNVIESEIAEKGGYIEGFCHAIDHTSILKDLHRNSINYYISSDYYKFEPISDLRDKCNIYKELKPYKPNSISLYWFERKDRGYKHIEILKEIISKM